MLIVGIVGPGGDHIVQIDSHGRTSLCRSAVRILLDDPLLRAAQLEVLPDVVQEDVQRGAAQAARPLAAGLVELDIHLTVLDGDITDQQLFQCLIQVIDHARLLFLQGVVTLHSKAMGQLLAFDVGRAFDIQGPLEGGQCFTWFEACRPTQLYHESGARASDQ